MNYELNFDEPVNVNYSYYYVATISAAKNSNTPTANKNEYWSKDYNMALLREGAWYYTPDRAEKDGLTPKEKEIRRLAFLREGLRRAKLLDE